MPKSLRELYDELRLTQDRGRQARVVSPSEDLFIVKLTQLVLSCGVQARATDIHVEPTMSGLRVRYRIDGMLYEMLQLPQEIRDALIRSIKVKANMATDGVGRSKPQDSRLDFEAEGHKLDLRFSSFPTLFGDALTIRVLDHLARLPQLAQLGLRPDVLREFEGLARGPSGLVLVTGPSNSGKTTTLYTVLSKLRSLNIKIVTLEDPIEYQMEGVVQGQINPSIGLTFASGLRAIMRQDTNVIFVGEIRDVETADIAIRAALTGHLVFSTLHTRHSFGAIHRLLDMGVESHLLLASVTGVLSQRLVRLICANCKRPDPTFAKVFTQLWNRETGASPPESRVAGLSKGVGCPSCNASGYYGRTGVFELLVLNDDLKQLILDRASSRLYKTMTSKLRTMLLDGLEKAAQGLTTVEEVLRVAGETEE